MKFRTLFAQGIFVGAIGLGIAILVVTVIQDGTGYLLQTAAAVLAGIGVVWVLFGNPKVEVADGGITIVNIVRTVHVPWPAVESVGSKWSLSVQTAAGTYNSWAIPAPSGTGNRLRSAGRRKSADPDGSRALTTGAHADAVALVIAQRLESLTNAGYLDGAKSKGIEPSIQFNNRELIICAIAVVCVAALVLPV